MSSGFLGLLGGLGILGFRVERFFRALRLRGLRAWGCRVSDLST